MPPGPRTIYTLITRLMLGHLAGRIFFCLFFVLFCFGFGSFYTIQLLTMQHIILDSKVCLSIFPFLVYTEDFCSCHLEMASGDSSNAGPQSFTTPCSNGHLGLSSATCWWCWWTRGECRLIYPYHAILQYQILQRISVEYFFFLLFKHLQTFPRNNLSFARKSHK